jgi:drug/metabolite transporter (DMT)-like permease
MSRKRFYLFGFGALALFDTLTQVSFKLASTHGGAFSMTLDWLLHVLLSTWIIGAVVGYLGSFFTWMTLLKHAPVGPAFAASHIEVVTVLAISVVYFGEHLSATQLAGSLCILLGIICLSLSEEAAPHD